jgi:hypothetical protein
MLSKLLATAMTSGAEEPILLFGAIGADERFGSKDVIDRTGDDDSSPVRARLARGALAISAMEPKAGPTAPVVSVA